MLFSVDSKIQAIDSARAGVMAEAWLSALREGYPQFRLHTEENNGSARTTAIVALPDGRVYHNSTSHRKGLGGTHLWRHLDLPKAHNGVARKYPTNAKRMKALAGFIKWVMDEFRKSDIYARECWWMRRADITIKSDPTAARALAAGDAFVVCDMLEEMGEDADAKALRTMTPSAWLATKMVK